MTSLLRGALLLSQSLQMMLGPSIEYEKGFLAPLCLVLDLAALCAAASVVCLSAIWHAYYTHSEKVQLSSALSSSSPLLKAPAVSSASSREVLNSSAAMICCMHRNKKHILSLLVALLL